MNEVTEYYLQHHGIKGMRWGVRRFQDKSGDLTPAGKKRYITVRQAAKNATQARKEAVRSLNESPKKHTLAQYNAAAKKAHRESIAADKAHNKELRAEKSDKTLKKAKTDYKNAKKEVKEFNKSEKEKTKSKLTFNEAVNKGRKVASGLLVASLTDDIFYGGAGKKTIAKGAGFVKNKVAGYMLVKEAERIIRR